MTRKRTITILGAVIGVVAVTFVLAGVLHDGGTAEAQAPPATYVKNSMPDFGQHSGGWCWAAAAANSFWWYAYNVADQDGLLGGGSAPYPWEATDINSQTPGSACQGGATSWYDANDMLQGHPGPANNIPGYKQVLSQIAKTTFYDKNQDGLRDPDGPDNVPGNADDENHYCYSEGVEKWDYLIGIRDYVNTYGTNLVVHDIIDPLLCNPVPPFVPYVTNRSVPTQSTRNPCGPGGVGGVPGVTQTVQSPTFLDYQTELSASQDVLLWMQPPFGYLPETAHVVTGVGYDTVPATDQIYISDPWTHDDVNVVPVQHDDTGLPGWLGVQPENPGQCNDVNDDDGDGRLNDGCIPVMARLDCDTSVPADFDCADANEAELCANVTSDDGEDAVVNDGCPPMGAPDHNNSSSHEAPPLPARPYETCIVQSAANPFRINCGGTPWVVYDMIFVSPAVPEPVGGVAEFPAVAEGGGWSTGTYAALAGGLAAAFVALSAGAWYARKRWAR